MRAFAVLKILSLIKNFQKNPDFTSGFFIISENNNISNCERRFEMKKSVAIAFTVILLLAFTVTSFAQESSKSWYCVRNKNHLQPIVGADISFVESYGGYYIDHKHGDSCEDKVLYLTFDAGYENGNVAKILDVLKQKNAPGAFFVLRNLIVKNTDLVKRMADEGHLVCNHTSLHPDMSKKVTFEDFSAELGALETVYREYTGREVSKYFRPPEGRFNTDTLRFAQQMGYSTVFWSFAYEDWNNSSQMSTDAAKKKVLDNIHNGAVILLHPTSDTNAQILGDIIDECRAQGYRFSTLDELTAK